MNGAASGYTEMPLNYKVFLAQFNAIKQIAKEGPCVMIGRCADYALADFDNCISIFVHADMDKRIKRIASKYALTEAKARDQILKLIKSVPATTTTIRIKVGRRFQLQYVHRQWSMRY